MPDAPDAPRLTRRRFFRLGVAGSVLLGAGGVLAWQTTGYELAEPLRRRLRALSVKQYRIVEAVAARILRSDDAASGFPSPEEVDVALHVDGLMAQLHPLDRRDLGRLLHVLEHALPPWAGVFGRFTRVTDEERDTVLRAMATGESGLLRAAFEGLKSLVSLAYFRHERTWAAIGYDGPLVGRPRGGFGAGA